MALTQEQINTIKATVPVLEQYGGIITTTFYKNMLSENPELKNVFNSANQITGHQPRALAQSVYAYAANIDNLGALSAAVENICNKHASLYIRPEQYNIVGTYLLAAMKQVLGDALTPEIHDAWAAAYWQLANIMIDREAQLYKEGGDWTDWKKFKIAKKVAESAEITSLYLEPVENVDGKALPPFKPGQYISVMLDVPNLNHQQARQYSLSDSPNSNYYRISVKKESGVNPTNPEMKAHPGYVSNILHDIKKEGDVILVSHPRGDFFLSEQSVEKSHPIVLISAGVGLTPLMSILNTVACKKSSAAGAAKCPFASHAQNSGTAAPTGQCPFSGKSANASTTPHSSSSPRKIHFIHGTRSTEAQAFRKHLLALQTKTSSSTDNESNSQGDSDKENEAKPRSNLDVHVTFFNKTPAAGDVKGKDYHHVGRIDLDKLDRDTELYLNDPKTEYYVCGPEGFMTETRKKLVQYGVDVDRVKLELFGTGGVPAA
ncbi:flavohemo protein [Xylona heveae TC161]|uniref:nitric oxide dioxygenase n=1 Tax=Xylona heveae (strain CBS 132557 / TC161) TaxID=1328760 RepID=A0A165FZY0_XYLHT|nr:flavohemo protein [Xylona heveae TC161]KZF21579.1 flavohemo protein [Xylona heveae TC161]